MKRQHPMLRLAAVSLFLAASLAASGRPARAGGTTINTALLAGYTGYLDFQFDPGTTGTPLDASAAITLTDLGGGTLAAAPPTITGAGTGDLDPSATISNTDATNDILKGFTFGSSLTFDTTFTFTPNANADDSSDFFLILRDANLNAISTTDPSGNDFIALTSLDAQGNAPALTVYQINAAPVPELSSFLSLGLLLLLGTGSLILRGAVLARRRVINSFSRSEPPHTSKKIETSLFVPITLASVKHIQVMPILARTGLALAFLITAGVGPPASAQDQVIQTYGTGTPDNSWAYSKHVGVGHPDINYYPDSADISQAVFQGYVSTPTSAEWGGGQFFGDDTTFVFDTNITSDVNRTLSLSLDGDDGHSAYVNGQFVGGGGFGVFVNFDLILKAGVPINLEVADHNAAGAWALLLQDQLGDPITTVSGVTLNAAPVPEASTLVAFGLLLGLGGITVGRRKKHNAFGH